MSELNVLTTAVAILQNDIKAVAHSMGEARAEHKEMVEKFFQLERRVDTLVIGIEAINKQLSDFIMHTQKSLKDDDTERGLMHDRIGSLEILDKEDSVRQEERDRATLMLEKQKATSLTRWNFLLACFMAFLAAIEIWDKFFRVKV